jgi:hypothetical protein
MSQLKKPCKQVFLPRIMAHAGAITVERTWRAKGRMLKRKRGEP